MIEEFYDIKNDFKEEGYELLQSMEDSLLYIREHGFDEEAVGSIFRAVHTIKGSSSMFDVSFIVEFAHTLENLLDKIREKKIAINDRILGLLLESKDHIGELIHIAVDGDGNPSQETLAKTDALLEQVTDCLTGKQSGVALDEKSPEATKEPAEKSIKNEREIELTEGAQSWHISLRFAEDILEEGMDPISFISYLSEIGEIYRIETLTDEIPTIDRLNSIQCYMGVELDILTDASKERLEEVFEFIEVGSKIHVFTHNDEEAVLRWIKDLKGEDEEALLEILAKGRVKTKQSKAAPKGEKKKESVEKSTVTEKETEPRVEKARGIKPAVTKISTSQSLRVDAEKIDNLINLIGEMVIANANVIQKATEQQNSDLIESVSVMSRMVEEIRESAMQVRMMQIGDTFNKFKRIVHDTSLEVGKETLLEIRGGDTELDKTVIEKIGDPLIHIVRNCIDHGIEKPEIRKERGKPGTGTIKMCAYHKAGSIEIIIRDDGGGIDTEKVLAGAIEKGLAKEDDHLSQKEIYGLLFEPGFSTAKEITSISGRGVGMDVVKKNIESLRGTIEVSSEVGKGSSFTIRLPLTLAIIDGFLFKTAQTSYVIPLEMVEECIELTHKERDELQGNGFINLRGTILPLIDLGEFFKEERKSENRENIIVVKFGDEKIGLIVDDLKGEFQTVIKPLGKLFRKLKGIGGATILGSGEVALILDVSNLVSEVVKKSERDKL